MNRELYIKLWFLKQKLLENKDLYVLVSEIFFGLYCDYVINLDDIVLANYVRDNIYRCINSVAPHHAPFTISFGQRTAELNKRRKLIYVDDNSMSTIADELLSKIILNRIKYPKKIDIFNILIYISHSI
uniref:Uncharacterized protein n=1 Tax=viral metagenome TaxID=1070528 RepID=A0A6C0C7W5_9ZZZZ